MEVGYGGEVLCRESAVESVEPFHSVILILDVSLHEAHVGRHALEERARKGLAQHGDPHVGILPCERIDHGHGHGHVSHGRESHYEYVLCPHLLFLAYNTGFVAGSLYIFICL